MSNLSIVLGALSKFEKVFLIRCLNERGIGEAIHLGSLPLINHEYAVRCLRAMIPVNDEKTPTSRMAKSLILKLGGQVKGTTTFLIRLDDLKVFRRSSGDGVKNRVMKLPGFRKSTAGIQWSQFAGTYKRVPTVVQLQASMSRCKKGMWSVTVPLSYAEHAKQHIFNLCG